MDMISAGIIGLVFILLIVFCVLAAKTWHWVNIVFLILTFMVGVGASIGLAQVFELRTSVMKEATKYEDLAEKNKKEADLAVFGSPDAINYDAGSLRGANLALSLAMTGRGRVWSGGQVAAEGELRTFQFAVERPAENSTKLKDVLMYVFADGEISAKPYPQTYIGSILVAEETPAVLKLQPLFISNVGEWTQPSTTWSLFEKMPLDRHDTFKDGIVAFVAANPDTAPEPLKNLAASIANDEEIDPSVYRQILMGNYLRAELFGLDPASADYEQLIDRFAFDKMSLGKIQNWIEANTASRVSQRFDPVPEEVFVKYRFDADSTKTYQVDADGRLETDGPFTPLGHAIEPALHANKEISFAKGDTVLVDQRTAEGYQRGADQVAPFSQGEEVTEVDRIYKRQLRNYPYMLANFSEQTENAIEETQRVNRNNAVQLKALQDAQTQLQDRLNSTAGYTDDIKNLKNDQDTIDTLLAKRQGQNRDYKAQIVSLTSKIQETYQRIQEKARAAEQQAFAGR